MKTDYIKIIDDGTPDFTTLQFFKEDEIIPNGFVKTWINQDSNRQWWSPKYNSLTNKWEEGLSLEEISNREAEITLFSEKEKSEQNEKLKQQLDNTQNTIIGLMDQIMALKGGVL